MATMTRPTPAVKARRPAALDWPASGEVDGYTWEIGPDAGDVAPYTAEDADFWAGQCVRISLGKEDVSTETFR
jgi:hypothetical protein